MPGMWNTKGDPATLSTRVLRIRIHIRIREEKTRAEEGRTGNEIRGNTGEREEDNRSSTLHSGHQTFRREREESLRGENR